MKTENEFNSYLSKKFRELSPEVKYMKTSDKYGIGVSDFLIYTTHLSLALECKFINEWPAPNSRLLRHVFDGPQITFLETHHLAGQKAGGLIAVKETREIFVVKHTQIPRNGNWITDEFRHIKKSAISWEEPAQGIIAAFKVNYAWMGS